MFKINKNEAVLMIATVILVPNLTPPLDAQTKNNMDPEAILQAVYNARQQLPSCKFQLAYSERRERDSEVVAENRYQLKVNYKDSNFLIRRPGYQLAMRLNNANYVYYYDGGSTPWCNIFDLKQSGQPWACMIDPQALGLTAKFGPRTTLKSVLIRGKSTDTSFLRQERWQDISCAVVRLDRLNNSYTYRKTYWIDVDKPFRVLQVRTKTFNRSETDLDARYSATIRSNYDDGFADGFLPTQVEIKKKSHSTSSSTQWVRTIQLSDYEPIEEPVEFSLASLEMERGTPVTDIRVHRRIGYWDGEKLVDLPLRSRPRSEQRRLEAREAGGISLWIYVVAGVVLVLVGSVAGIWWFRRSTTS